MNMPIAFQIDEFGEEFGARRSVMLRLLIFLENTLFLPTPTPPIHPSSQKAGLRTAGQGEKIYKYNAPHHPYNSFGNQSL